MNKLESTSIRYRVFKVFHPLREGEQLILLVYSHSYWLGIFCTTNSSPVLERERWQNVVKTQFFLNTLYMYVHVCMFSDILDMYMY